MKTLSLVFILICLTNRTWAQADHSPDLKGNSQHSMPSMEVKKHSYPMSQEDCKDMEVFEPTMSMCMPLPMNDMPMKMIMLTGNGFLVGSNAQGPRGRREISSPNMFMLDAGTTVGNRHYLNLDLMGTFERWTFPEKGYPELLQIGEKNAQGQPYLDAQHPHSSPIMGLTLSDTIRLGEGKNYLKVFFAPRGAATDGPIAFMHRPTGAANPDAPLGHHIGQDISHITSTVVGSSLSIGKTKYQISTFNGKEPEPTKVDLPMEKPNSGAFRLIQAISPKLLTMGSVAYVQFPEGEGLEPSGEEKPAKQWRLSGSLYSQHDCFKNWKLYNSLIYGYITDYEHASAISAFGQEFWLKGDTSRWFTRAEVLQRTPRHLQITTSSDQDTPHWVTALTLGYSYALAQFESGELALGSSVTKSFLPEIYKNSYGGDPWAGKIFLQLKGMGMWDI